MFIDLAYLIRHVLKELGHTSPDVVGLFLLPPADPSLSPKPQVTKALGNTFAALTELNHFSSPGVTFSARYGTRDATITDPDPPFSRFILLSPPPDGEAEETLTGLAGDFLYRDLVTPLGRTADACRAAPQAPSSGLSFQTFGLYRYSWPRRALLKRAARRFCQNLAQRWMNKDAKPLRETIKSRLQEEWAGKELGAESLIARLHAACERALGQPAEAVFTAVTGPFGTKEGRGQELDPTAVAEAVGKLEEMVGQPVESSVLYRAGTLEVLSKGKVVLTLPGVPEPESFRHSIIDAYKAWVPGKANTPIVPASAPS